MNAPSHSLLLDWIKGRGWSIHKKTTKLCQGLKDELDVLLCEVSRCKNELCVLCKVILLSAVAAR
jgi:hypothetical protein